MTESRSSLDDLRTEFPHLGFAVYAYEPGQPVTLEVHSADGGVFAFQDRTLTAAIHAAFPPRDPPETPPPSADVFG